MQQSGEVGHGKCKLLTTVIGSYPKPDFLKLPDWFKSSHRDYEAGQLNQYFKTTETEGTPRLKTTVIGSYPKPDTMSLPDWFRSANKDRAPVEFNKYLDTTDVQAYTAAEFNQYLDRTEVQEREASIKQATQDCIDEQVAMGIDIITDGEICRENYIYHFCRKLKNFDFENLTYKVYRNGACKTYVPTIRGPLEHIEPEPWCVKEWQANQAMTETPVKMTMPGPMTIINSTANSFYQSDKELSEVLVRLIIREVVALAAAGCKYIQIDEPLLVRSPQVALEYGIDHLWECFCGVGPDVEKTIHLCCGYPEYLDQKDYMKADRQCYFDLAEKLDNAGFDAVSIEDAHSHNDLTLLNKFKKVKVIFGVVAVAKSEVETVQQIKGRVEEALQHIPRDRLMLAPDCGLGFLPRDILRQKLQNLVTVANGV